MLESVTPLIGEWQRSKWLTIGDGNFGSDAHFLRANGIDVTATSISTTTLEIAHTRGWIDEYAAENAEHLTLPDNAVEVVLCKEALHHFPRPAMGFYEMLRVARSALALIEPIEGGPRPISGAKRMVKSLLRGGANDEFEACGNFLYRLSIREIAKMLTALGHPCFAWKGINDFYHPGFKSDSIEHLSRGWLVTRFGIVTQDVLSRLRLLNFGLAAVICFKQRPPARLLVALRRGGFTTHELPRNPYVGDLPASK